VTVSLQAGNACKIECLSGHVCTLHSPSNSSSVIYLPNNSFHEEEISEFEIDIGLLRIVLEWSMVIELYE